MKPSIEMWKATLIGVAMCVAAVFILWALVGCDDSDGCTVEETRCEGSVSQICNADQNWEAIVDCLTLEPGEWACCVREGIEECNLVEECD